MREKIVRYIKENIYASVFIGIMAIIYIIMMFFNKPWYDELYTYYSFISRGPIYAAIHWPVPNNHVGYSVISACLNIFHNSYISLRGISCIAAIINLILIYRIGTYVMKKPYAFLAMGLYAGANIVHMLSVQGRGYTLAITCYLVAVIAGYKICIVNYYEKKYYIIFIASLVAGLYILPSSIYWVLPVCVGNGLFLLLKKHWKMLLNLIAAAIIAALITLFLYSLIWLAIGANLLCKEAGSAYYGMHQIKVIVKAPLKSARTGIEYMLATPYIQSIDKRAAILGMPAYFEEFFSQCYSYCGMALCLLMVFLIAFFVYYSIMEIKYRRIGLWVGLFISSGLSVALAMLLIQSVHPYKRVLSFIMVDMAIGTAYLFYRWIEHSGLTAKTIKKVEYGVIAFIILVVAFKMTTYNYRRPLADRENNIEEILKKINVTEIDSIYYTDDYQKYVLKFYHNIEPVEAPIEEANYVIICSEIFESNYQENVWPVLMPNDQPFIKYVEDNFEEMEATEHYVAYCRK
ncbi:MAG: glycosyltransferase family 39 protein [Lachnospiraceae bacterium]|nr:glycosyltransferase family 39 protein [Candidatus Colinaster scatohippi]